MKEVSIILISVFLSQSALAQIPIDPLRLPQEETGSYIYTFGVNYTPDGREGLDVNDDGDVFGFKVFYQSITFSGSASYSFNPYISISANVNPNWQIIKETRDFGFRRQTITETNTDIGGGLSLEYRPVPQASLDPRISLGIDYPWNLTLQGQASLIRDPVILLTSLGYTQSLESDSSSLNLGLGAGFVANDRISFSGFASYAIPIGEIDLPIASLSFRTGYNLDDKGNQDIGFRTTFSVRGGEARIGIGIEWGGRGVVTRIIQPETSPNESETK